MSSAGAVQMDMKDNKQFLTDLFAGPFRGHAIIMNHPQEPYPFAEGDYTLDRVPLRKWVDRYIRDYEAQLKWHRELGDDAVPNMRLQSNTGIFAACFGCPVHVYEDSPSMARPIVTTPEEADRLPQPDPSAQPLARFFELAEMIQERVGPEVSLGAPDIQSSFDIAAIVWNKQDFYLAMYDNPGAVRRLTGKCHLLLEQFFKEFIRRFPNCNLNYWPNAWAPPELGVWLSEDEPGAMTPDMFEKFCLPSLVALSETFGGLFMHCCAAADHQYANFKKIPNFRGLQRVYQEPGPLPAIQAFSGRTVIMHVVNDEDEAHALLDMALPETRFLFNFTSMPRDDAKRALERLRARAPKV